MKRYALPIAALLLLAWSGCSSSHHATSSTNSPRIRSGDQVIMVAYPTSLANILLRAPGVVVNDAGLNTTVTIRGGTPLFVLNGVRLGRSYAAAANAVDVNSITAVEVLTEPGETMIYGRDTQFGVIVIHTGNFELGDQ